jgi:hypothetical protein
MRQHEAGGGSDADEARTGVVCGVVMIAPILEVDQVGTLRAPYCLVAHKMRLQHAARAWRQVRSTEQVLLGGVRSVHNSGWTGAAAGAGDQRASSEDNAFVKARRAYQAELHKLRKTFTQDVSEAQAKRQEKTDAVRKAHNQRIWSEKALRDAEKAKRAAANVAAQHELMLQKVRRPHPPRCSQLRSGFPIGWSLPQYHGLSPLG